MSEIQSGRILSDEYGTRYVELSANWPRNLSWGEVVEQKVAGFDGSHIALAVSGEAAARIVLTEQEFGVLVASYQQYRADEEQRRARMRVERVVNEYDPFLDSDDLP